MTYCNYSTANDKKKHNIVTVIYSRYCRPLATRNNVKKDSANCSKFSKRTNSDKYQAGWREGLVILPVTYNLLLGTNVNYRYLQLHYSNIVDEHTTHKRITSTNVHKVPLSLYPQMHGNDNTSVCIIQFSHGTDIGLLAGSK